MRVQTGRDIGRIWLIAVALFALTVVAVRSMGRDPGTQMVALGIGYVGLAAIGAALIFTTRWVDRAGPSSRLLRAALQLVLGAALVAWLVSLIFPLL